MKCDFFFGHYIGMFFFRKTAEKHARTLTFSNFHYNNSTQHTVFGQIADDASFTLLDTIFTMPTHKAGLTMLDEELKFTMHIE